MDPTKKSPHLSALDRLIAQVPHNDQAATRRDLSALDPDENGPIFVIQAAQLERHDRSELAIIEAQKRHAAELSAAMKAEISSHFAEQKRLAGFIENPKTWRRMIIVDAFRLILGFTAMTVGVHYGIHLHLAPVKKTLAEQEMLMRNIADNPGAFVSYAHLTRETSKNVVELANTMMPLFAKLHESGTVIANKNGSIYFKADDIEVIKNQTTGKNAIRIGPGNGINDILPVPAEENLKQVEEVSKLLK